MVSIDGVIIKVCMMQDWLMSSEWLLAVGDDDDDDDDYDDGMRG